MTSIPLYVSAAGIMTVIAAAFAVSLWLLAASYPRPYVRMWQQMWTAFALYAFASGAALLATNVAALTGWRVLFGLLALLGAWWHLWALEEGTRLLCAPETSRPRWRLGTVGALLVLAAAILTLPAALAPGTPMQRYLVRVSLLAVAWGLAYTAAGWQILRTQALGSALGRQLLGGAMLVYGVLRALEPLTHLLGPNPLLEQFLTFGGIPLLVLVATGGALMLLDVERTRAIDETEARLRAEQTANASEALLATALSSSGDPVLIVDPRGRLMVFNEQFAAVLRRVRGIEAAPGLPVDQLVGLEASDFWRDAFSRAICGESHTRVEPFVLAPGAPPTQFGIRVTPVRRDGEVIGVLLVAHNATEEERLRSTLASREQWFRKMIENSSDIIFQIGPDGTVDYASPSLDRLLGLKMEQVVGADAFSYVHPDDVDTLRDAMLKSFARDDSVPTTVPFRARAANGQYVDLEAVSKPYEEADGSPRLIVSARDVRERRRLEGELIAARRLESVGRLAGGVAHDFNNLLTVVVGNLALIRAHEDTAAVADHVDEIEHAVQRGAELTRRLLAFARRQMIEPRILTLRPQIVELERLLRRLIGDHVRLDLEVPDELWSVRVDPLALEQMLVNMVVNARDAMPDGGVVTISGSNLAIAEESPQYFGVPAGAWVRLDVRDTGTGIDESVLGQIFEPFFTTKGESGTGLGLATVYGAVRQAGGQIRVHSEINVGTTFSLFFPRVVEPVARPADGISTTQLARARPGEQILLIEDEASVRDVTEKLLTKLGYGVITANDGLDGVAKAASHQGPLSLVLSDLMMPELGGAEAVSRIHERRPRLPVIFISGYSAKALDWGDTMPSGGRLLSKPFSVEELARAIRESIDAAAVGSLD